MVFGNMKGDLSRKDSYSPVSQVARSPSDNPFSKESLAKLSKNDLINIIMMQQDMQIPASIFSSDTPPLEALVKYLVEKKSMPFRMISSRLNRNFKTIWTTYNNAKNRSIAVPKDDFSYSIPLSIFSKDDLSILESLVRYLHDHYKLEFCRVAKLLRKDIRTVWTCYNRSDKKLTKGQDVKSESNIWRSIR